MSHQMTTRRTNNSSTSTSTPLSSNGNKRQKLIRDSIAKLSPIASEEIESISPASALPSAKSTESLNANNKVSETVDGSDDDTEYGVSDNEVDQTSRDSNGKSSQLHQDDQEAPLSLEKQFYNCLRDFYGESNSDFLALTQTEEGIPSLPTFLFGIFSYI